MRIKRKPPEWKPWFAWLPVEVDNQVVWWELIERQVRVSSFDYGEYYLYRFPEQRNETEKSC